ncbi:MAG: T9SS type A sorting domain-containing protein [Bacteroidota bacterium]
MKRFSTFLFGAFLVSLQSLHAQCVVIPNCPTSAVSYCDGSPNSGNFWHGPTWYDPIHATNDLAEGAVDLSISAFDTCFSGNLTISYQLLLDLDGNDLLETVVDSKNPPPSGFVYFNNLNNPNFSGGEKRQFDQRNLPNSLKYRFGMQLLKNNGVYTAKVQWLSNAAVGLNQLPQLPYGNHKIKWFIENEYGYSEVCTYSFSIRDCKKPVVHCLNGISANLMPTKFIQLWATDFLQYATDNITPPSLLKYSIRKAGTGTGFPVDANGSPIESLVFVCSDIGVQEVELWAMDEAGNAGYCTTYVIINDNGNYCTGTNKISLCTQTYCSHHGMSDVAIEAHGHSNAIPTFTFTTLADAQGCISNFGFPIPLASNTTFSAFKDDNPLNGVSIYDLQIIQNHINGTQPFTKPWQWVAADANRDNMVDAFDLEAFNKLILGIYSELPNNASWRFVRDDYVFPAGNPLSAPIPDTFSLSEVLLPPGSTPRYLLGIKIGDLDCGAFFAASPEDRGAVNGVSKNLSTVLPALPNPSSGAVVITVIAEQASHVELDVIDLNGKLVFHNGQSIDGGVQYLNIPAEAFPGTGLYPYRVRIGEQVFSGKIVRVE